VKRTQSASIAIPTSLPCSTVGTAAGSTIRTSFSITVRREGCLARFGRAVRSIHNVTRVEIALAGSAARTALPLGFSNSVSECCYPCSCVCWS
jgi:hypothetical protein